eukprot:g5315.t1
MSYPPDEVNWPAYTHAELFSGKVIGWILMWTVLIIYFIMYGAYAYDFGTSLMVAGAESDMIAELILSIMMAVGTHEKFQRMFDYGFFFCLLVVFGDLGIVLTMSQAAQLNATAAGNPNTITQFMAEQWYGMLMPGFLVSDVMPYIAESVFDTILPRYLGGLIVGARPDMSHWYAEKALEGPEMNPVWRYVDMANFFSVTMCMLGFCSMYHWLYNVYIFLAIAFAIGLIYCVDYVRLLRGQTVCFAETSMVCLNFWFYWQVPCFFTFFMMMLWWVKTLYIRNPWLFVLRQHYMKTNEPWHPEADPQHKLMPYSVGKGYLQSYPFTQKSVRDELAAKPIGHFSKKASGIFHTEPLAQKARMEKKLTRELAAGKPAEVEAGKESKSAEGAAKPAKSSKPADSKKDDLSGTDLTTTAGGEKEKPPEPEDEKK